MPSAYRVIPVFLPMLACPHRCVYCNQYVISGQQKLPSLEQVTALIDRNLQTIPHDCHKRVAFFGGSFTCLPEPVQNRYLDAVQPYLQEGRIEGIQLSTRPDYIDPAVLDLLKAYSVTSIELGAQSMCDDILALNERGHTAEQVRNAASLIRSAGLTAITGSTDLPDSAHSKRDYRKKAGV